MRIPLLIVLFAATSVLALSTSPSVDRSAAVFTGRVLSTEKVRVVGTDDTSRWELWKAEVRLHTIVTQDVALAEKLFIYYAQDWLTNYVAKDGSHVSRGVMAGCPARPQITINDIFKFYCIRRDVDDDKQLLFIPERGWAIRRTSILAEAADRRVPASTNAPNAHPLLGPPGTIIGINRAADRVLVFRYEFEGRTNEQSLVLNNSIADFHFCPWAHGRGIAFALSDTQGKVYWATAYFAHLGKPLSPRQIRSPDGYNLMGIASPVGDTIVITAMDLRSDEQVLARGWMYKNSCPPAWDVFVQAPTNAPNAQIQMGGFDHLTKFEIPRPKPQIKR